jgi:SAM-dependent methyltransferase
VPASPRRLTFGAHADAYEAARPEWPPEAARWLAPEEAGLVVEVGAGTGKLTRALAAVGRRILAVEPDPRMLAVLRELELAAVETVEGEAEALPLDDGEAATVVAGSALHWFDLDAALPEFHRVLRPGGTLSFGWNHRDIAHPAIARMSELIHDVRPVGQSWHRRDWSGRVTAGGLFGDVEHARFPFVLELPRERLHDHLLSYSGLAALPDAAREPLFAEIGEVLDADAEVSRDGRLALPFVVDAYRAVRRAAPAGSRSP